MLHKVPFLFTPLLAAVMVLLAVLSIGVSELMMDAWSPEDLPMEQDPATGEWRVTVVPLRHFSMPNYWVYYHADDVVTALRSLGHTDMYPLILVTLFNACASTWLVCAAHISVIMFLAVRMAPRNSALLQWVWLVPFVAFVADLVEDLCLLVILVNFPMGEFPVHRHVLAWSSMIKFLFWAVSLLIDAVWGAQLALYGPRGKSKV
jgi:hypothetical protein